MGTQCSYDPREMAGLPIGMFHCPECGEMVLAGMEHPNYVLFPQRIQRKCTRGWRMPPNTIYVGRPTKHGNNRHLTINQYRLWAQQKCSQEPGWLEPLRDKNLACWCPLDEPCHADILLALANAEK